MNRRSFLGALAKGVAAFTILPSAGRVWKAQKEIYYPVVEHTWVHLYRSPHFEHTPTLQDFLRENKPNGYLPFDEIIAVRNEALEQLGPAKIWPPNMGDVTCEVIKYDKPRALDDLLSGPRIRSTLY